MRRGNTQTEMSYSVIFNQRSRHAPVTLLHHGLIGQSSTEYRYGERNVALAISGVNRSARLTSRSRKLRARSDIQCISG